MVNTGDTGSYCFSPDDQIYLEPQPFLRYKITIVEINFITHMGDEDKIVLINPILDYYLQRNCGQT